MSQSDHFVNGQFISPDTIVPDPTNVLDYNRYMYVRGNPINMNDPSGHQSASVTAPTQWVYFFDALLTVAEEMGFKPTAVTVYTGPGAASAGIGVHADGSAVGQFTYNWYSGQVMLSQATNGGGKMGPMADNGGKWHLGVEMHFNASDTRSLQNASWYLSGISQAEFLVEGGATFIVSQSADYVDRNGDNQFNFWSENLDAGTPFKPFFPTGNGMDPIFKTPVTSLGMDLSVGFDVLPNVLEGGVGMGVQDTNEFRTYNSFSDFFGSVGKSISQIFE